MCECDVRLNKRGSVGAIHVQKERERVAWTFSTINSNKLTHLRVHVLLVQHELDVLAVRPTLPRLLLLLKPSSPSSASTPCIPTSCIPSPPSLIPSPLIHTHEITHSPIPRHLCFPFLSFCHCFASMRRLRSFPLCMTGCEFNADATGARQGGLCRGCCVLLCCVLCALLCCVLWCR